MTTAEVRFLISTGETLTERLLAADLLAARAALAKCDRVIEAAREQRKQHNYQCGDLRAGNLCGVCESVAALDAEGGGK